MQPFLNYYLQLRWLAAAVCTVILGPTTRTTCTTGYCCDVPYNVCTISVIAVVLSVMHIPELSTFGSRTTALYFF
jgi:hypothetical protein